MSEEEYRGVTFAPLSTSETYGSTEDVTSEVGTASETFASSAEDGSDDSIETDSFDRRSFHLGMKKMNASNIWTSMRFTESFAGTCRCSLLKVVT